MLSQSTPLWSEHAAQSWSATRMRQIRRWPSHEQATLAQRERATPARVTREAALHSHPWLALLALGCGAFVALLDTSMVSVALPTLQAQFTSGSMQMIAAHPLWQATRGDLLEPGTHMGQVFPQVTLHASLVTWAMAVAFPTLGLVVLALLIVRRRMWGRKESAAWSRCYFFSPDGSITVYTMQRYLAAQPPHLEARSVSARLTWQSTTLFGIAPSRKGA